MSELPRPNRDTLAFLILHLQKVADSGACQMPANNLAVVMGPTIVGYSSRFVTYRIAIAVISVELKLSQFTMVPFFIGILFSRSLKRSILRSNPVGPLSINVILIIIHIITVLLLQRPDGHHVRGGSPESRHARPHRHLIRLLGKLPTVRAS